MKLQTLHIEFAANAPRTSTGLRGVVTLCALLCAAAAFVLGQSALEATRLARTLSDARGDAAPPPAAASRPGRADADELARVQLVRQTSHSLTTPWADLLGALESVPTRVALLSIDPSASKRTVLLSAEAARPQDMIDFLNALQNDRRLAHVTLVSHQVQEKAVGTPMRFQVQADWGPQP